MSTAVLTQLKPFVATTRSQVDRVVHALTRNRHPLALDTETTGLNPRQCKLVALQVQEQGRNPIIVDLRRDPRMVEAFQPVFDLRGVIGHNVKFDLQFLTAHGLRFKAAFDTMLAEQVWLGVGKSEAREAGMGLTLKDLAKRYDVLTEMSKEERSWFIDLDQRAEEWNAPFPAEQITYMALDTEVLWPIFKQLKHNLQRYELWEAAKLEMRALPAIAQMELRGIRIDLEGWRAFIEEKRIEAREAENKALATFGPPILDHRISVFDQERTAWEAARAALKVEEERLRAEYDSFNGLLKTTWGVYKLEKMAEYRASHEIPAKPKLDTSPPNLGSQQQLLVAFGALGIPVATKRNDKGERVPTTDSDSLEKLTGSHPEVKVLLDWRTAEKFVVSFGESLLQFAEDEGGVWALHPDYNSIGAGTGRMSCSNPNFQQVPHKGDGERLRELVRARPGYQLLTADFSNIELRILADLANDEQMLSMFASGEDLHARTAKLLFKLPDEWGKKETSEHIWKGGQSYRQAAKIVNYLIPYGGSAYAMAMQNDMPVEDAEELMAGWFGVFTGVASYLEGKAAEVHRTLKSRTVAGRWRKYRDPGPKPEVLWKPYDGTVPEGFVKVGREGNWSLRENGDHYQTRIKHWQKAWAGIERQARNSPIQGSSADITKLAVALFFEHTDPRIGQIVAVVHDEIVVEAPEMHAGVMAEQLSECMYQACIRYLHRVTIPRPDVHIGETWFHD